MQANGAQDHRKTVFFPTPVLFVWLAETLRLGPPDIVARDPPERKGWNAKFLRQRAGQGDGSHIRHER